MLRRIVCSLAFVALTSSTGFADKPAKPAKDEISAVEAEKFLVFFNQFADAVVKNKDDCAKMAGAINGVIDQNLALIKQANDAKAANKKLPKAVEEKMSARLKDMFPAMSKCKQDAGVMTAMKRLAPAPAPATK